MPNWSDEGFVISARMHGESNAVIGLFTQSHGRHMGLVHGGSGKSKKALIIKNYLKKEMLFFGKDMLPFV